MKVRLGMQRGMISLLDRDSGESWLEVAHGVNLEGLDNFLPDGGRHYGQGGPDRPPHGPFPTSARRRFFWTGRARRFLNREELSSCVFPLCTIQGRRILSADKGTKNVTDLDGELAILSSVAELIAKAVQFSHWRKENRRLRRIVQSGGRLPSI